MKRPVEGRSTTFRDRLENYWYYYKNHTIVGFLIIVVGLFGWLLSRSSGPPIALNIDVIGGTFRGNQNQLTDFEHSAAVAVFGRQGALHKGVNVDLLPIFGTLANPRNEQVAMSIMTQLSARSLDVLMLDPTDYRMFVHLHFLERLEYLKSLANVPSQAEGPKGYGFLVSASKKLSDFTFPTGSVIVVLANSSHKSAGLSLVRWLYQ